MEYQPSAAEFEILQVIWELEPVAVRDVYERISQQKDVGYTTVLKQIQRMSEKGVLSREADGNSHLYQAVVRPENIKQQLADRVLQTVFGGSAVDMVMHALGGEKKDPEALLALKKWLDEQIKHP